MARFYAGQPVVCIKNIDWWQPTPPVSPEDLPQLGRHYTVWYYGSPPIISKFGEHMMLRELTNLSYSEDGFAPITDEQVRGIIEEAHRVPSAREYEKL